MFHSHTTSEHDDRKEPHSSPTTSPTEAFVYSSDDPCGRHVEYNYHTYLAITILSFIILSSCSSNVPPNTVNRTPTPPIISPSPTPTAILPSPTPTAIAT